jgi:thioredoxin 1
MPTSTPEIYQYPKPALTTMNNGEPININEDSFDVAVTKSPVPVIVDFWAPWCGPCKMIAPVLDEIAKEKAEGLRVAKVNVDENSRLAGRFGIRSIPTLLLFKDGEVRETIVGLTSKQNLLNKISAL